MWAPDRFLPGYQAQTWAIDGAERAEGEPHVDLTATLVRRNPPRHERAVLYVHGWNDYFFQTNLADFWDSIGFDFYALDLRRYGRNLRRGLFAGYITSLADYASELDQAFRLILGDGHEKVTVSGHSTGGLVVSLWAADAEVDLNGVVLNSPWLDMSASPALMRALSPVINSVAYISPTIALAVSESSGAYAESIHSSMRGSWDYDLDYKSNPAFMIRFGWGKAIMDGQARVAEGLEIPTPVLALTSTRSNPTLGEWTPQAQFQDIVLDVDRIAQVVWRLGNNTTLVRVDGAVHDMALSAQPARDQFFAEIRRWAAAYLS